MGKEEDFKYAVVADLQCGKEGEVERPRMYVLKLSRQLLLDLSRMVRDLATCYPKMSGSAVLVGVPAAYVPVGRLPEHLKPFYGWMGDTDTGAFKPEEIAWWPERKLPSRFPLEITIKYNGQNIWVTPNEDEWDKRDKDWTEDTRGWIDTDWAYAKG